MNQDRTINFQDVEELSRTLKAARVSKERFSLDLPEKDVANGLYAAMKAEVERRGGIFILDDDTRTHILSAAKWLVSPNAKFGLMLCGLCGNGKTTLAKAISYLVEYVTERERGFTRRSRMEIVTAKNICRLCAAGEKFKDQLDAYESLFKTPMLIIDDLGEEPKEIMVYGMIHTPLIDLISERYSRRLLTIITTNLDTVEIKEKYGPRIYDRFCEMLTSIIFENESYRSGWRKSDHPVDNSQ